MCLQAAHRHCLTLKEPWKLQASSSSDRPRIGPGSVSQEFRLGRDHGRSPHDEPQNFGPAWPTASNSSTRTAVAQGSAYESDARRRLSRPGNERRTANYKTNPTSSIRAATVAGRQSDAPVDSLGQFGCFLSNSRTVDSRVSEQQRKGGDGRAAWSALR